jgi:hypothetical protein
MSSAIFRFAVPILAILGIAGTLLLECTINRPARPENSENLIVSDIHDAELSLTVKLAGGSHGLTGYGSSSYGGGFTDLEWGQTRRCFPFRIYTIIVFLVALPLLLAWGGHLSIGTYERQQS